MTLADLVGTVMLGSLVLYAVLAGADFGGGVWDLLASGPRASAQRKLIEAALAPVWEANHVWLILVVVLLFGGFPAAFAAGATALHVPLTLMLVGIVFRGSAFVFRQYGEAASQPRWGRVFAVASTITPVFLGVVLGAVTAGGIRVEDDRMTSGFFAPWLRVFPFTVGILTLALFAFLAAVYLALEAKDPALREDFRRRALVSGVLVAPAALVAGLSAGAGADHFRDVFLRSWWSWPLQLATGAAAVGALAALAYRRYRLARAAAVAQVGLIVVGWGLGQRPFLIAPDVTIAGAAAPAATLRLLLVCVVAGSFLLVPSLYWLLRIFKAPR